jgi:hypothetical protein
MTARPLLTLKPKTPEQVSGVPSLEPLPPRPPKREGPLNQLLTFVIFDRPPYHHATYDEAAQERTYLQAVADRTRRKGRKQEFRVMKVLNLSGAELAGKVVVLDPVSLDDVAVDAACSAHWGPGVYTARDKQNMARALRAYLDTLGPPT